MIVMRQMMLVKYAKPKGERRVTELSAQIMTYRIDAGSPTRASNVQKVASSVVRSTLKQREKKNTCNCKVNIDVRNFYRTHLKTIKVNKNASLIAVRFRH